MKLKKLKISRINIAREGWKWVTYNRAVGQMASPLSLPGNTGRFQGFWLFSTD